MGRFAKILQKRQRIALNRAPAANSYAIESNWVNFRAAGRDPGGRKKRPRVVGKLLKLKKYEGATFLPCQDIIEKKRDSVRCQDIYENKGS
jgi:hypothetical protein